MARVGTHSVPSRRSCYLIVRIHSYILFELGKVRIVRQGSHRHFKAPCRYARDTGSRSSSSCLSNHQTEVLARRDSNPSHSLYSKYSTLSRQLASQRLTHEPWLGDQLEAEQITGAQFLQDTCICELWSLSQMIGQRQRTGQRRLGRDMLFGCSGCCTQSTAFPEVRGKYPYMATIIHVLSVIRPMFRTGANEWFRWGLPWVPKHGAPLVKPPRCAVHSKWPSLFEHTLTVRAGSCAREGYRPGW